MKAYSTRAVDRRIAHDAEHDATLMCCASGCPLRWSVDFGARLCTAHAGTDPLQWPGITQRVIDIEADRAFRNQVPKPQAEHRHFTLPDKKAVGQRLRAALRNRGGRQWAERLQAREQAGDRLTDAQRAMWRSALNYGPTQGWPEEMREELEART